MAVLVNLWGAECMKVQVCTDRWSDSICTLSKLNSTVGCNRAHLALTQVNAALSVPDVVHVIAQEVGRCDTLT